ncbi:hypothetical protein HY629_01520 [Candidatus Uhrbacteria bacterium]|nr:hypothetical protein [Candidatus Uhrbacteria bacterium]
MSAQYVQFGEWKAREQAARQAEVEKILDEGFDAIPPGIRITSQLPAVESISLIRPQPDKRTEHIYVVPFYKSKQGTDRHFTATLSRKGVLAGERIPKELSFTRDQLRTEVVDAIERINPLFWYPIKETVLPPDEIRIEPGLGDEFTPSAVDPLRLQYARSLEGARFGGMSIFGGAIRGNYYVVVIERRGVGVMLCENPVVDNAAYLIRVSPGVPIPEKNAPRKEVGAFFENERVAEFLGKHKSELIAIKRAQGDDDRVVDVVIHRGTREQWQQRMQDAVNGLITPTVEPRRAHA